MMHLAKTAGLPFAVFTIDTGLLFPETMALKKRLEDFFGLTIEVLVPDLTVAQQAEAHGPELWRREPDLCCTMRKVLPLQTKLGQLDLLDHRLAPAAERRPVRRWRCRAVPV